MIAVAQGSAPWNSDKFRLETRTDKICWQLLGPSGHTGIVHRDRNDDFYPFHSKPRSAMVVRKLPVAVVLYTIAVRQVETAGVVRTCPAPFIAPIAQ